MRDEGGRKMRRGTYKSSWHAAVKDSQLSLQMGFGSHMISPLLVVTSSHCRNWVAHRKVPSACLQSSDFGGAFKFEGSSGWVWRYGGTGGGG
jgi:hypothetical protein